MPDFQTVSSALGAASFLAFTVSLLIGRDHSSIGRWLVITSASSAVWLATQYLATGGYMAAISPFVLSFVEVARSLAWFGLLFAILRQNLREASSRDTRLRQTRYVLLLGSTVMLGVLLTAQVNDAIRSNPWISKVILTTFLMYSVVGLMLVEQLFRNTSADRRWAVKYLCLGIGAIFAYDFVLYADAVLFNRIDNAIWTGRGAANAIAVPLIAVAAARNREWKTNLFVSRQIVFHSTALLGVGVYLLVMAGAGYYLRTVGGEWGTALRFVFSFAGLLLLIVIIGSAGIRSRLKLFLSKHFYRNKYDYGEVWLSFTNRLSQGDTNPGELRETMLRAVADIMDATGAVMWQKSVNDAFVVAANWEVDGQVLREIPSDHPIIGALKPGNLIIDVRAEAEDATIDGSSRVPMWLLEFPRAWLLVPIVHRDELLAILLLCEPRAQQRLSWEDRTLLGTLGRQAASYLALMHATEELTDSRQFDAFNRLSAFLVHDLKNVVAQLSLVTRNAERHGGNPEFIADAFNTIGDAVAKMNRMLNNLKHTHAGPTDLLDIDRAVQEAVKNAANRLPRPSLELVQVGTRVFGNRDRLLATLEHLLQNAQEATPEDGHVSVRVARIDHHVVIEVTDSGCGMTPEFIQNRLFKPFETTKGKGGMGIGVYESLHVARDMGGRLTVESSPGRGAVFRLWIPEAEASRAASDPPPGWEKSA